MAETIIALAGEVVLLVSALTPLIVSNSKIKNGTKCQLRSEMLRIYYKHKDDEQIRQYEYENFVLLYEAYKSLKGNSFIDKIYNDIKELTVNVYNTIKEDVVKQTPESYNILKDKLSRCLEIINE